MPIGSSEPKAVDVAGAGPYSFKSEHREVDELKGTRVGVRGERR